MTHRILILGGTTEAREFAAQIADRLEFAATLSLAGRTKAPLHQPVPVRIGGFGGTDGLAHYLSESGAHLLIDATHPFAANISRNAASAARATGIPILAIRRPPWLKRAGDNWTETTNVTEAAIKTGSTPRNIFLALGRQELGPFESQPQHRYLIRSVDPVEPQPLLPNARYITARGPFFLDDEKELLSVNAIDVIVAKNSGGDASYAKIAAARELGIEVVIVIRPALPSVETVETASDAVRWCLSHFGLSAKRGV